MNNLSHNIYITYSNQKQRDIKASHIINPLDKVITLDALILELFEINNFEIIIDETIGRAIIYKIIQDNNLSYFDYLQSGAKSLTTIYNFLLKINRNEVDASNLLSGEKLQAIETINTQYQLFKKENSLVDIADIEKIVFDKWDQYFSKFNNTYGEVFIDSFQVGTISFIKSYFQEKILKNFSSDTQIPNKIFDTGVQLIQPSNEVFDNIDEIKTALKITRKLLENGTSSDDILIVASDIQEYDPLYKLFLDEYALKGYSSIGTPLSAFLNSSNEMVKIAQEKNKGKYNSLKILLQKLNLHIDKNIETILLSSTTIQDEKIGIELTEPNQIVGLSKKYKHIIFIGTDINHFPPKSTDNFLYSYENDVEYFYANNYFTSSQTQLDELKRIAENLYIITASYSGKRELSRSILIDDNFDEKIDISDIKSINELALENKTTKLNLEYLDEVKVEGIKATHLSASQINRYLSCPLQYLFSSKLKLQVPNQSEEGFDVMEQGSLMHLCYELFGRKIKSHKITSVDTNELYELMYQVSLEAYNHEETVKNRDEENIHHKLFLNTLQAGLKDDRDKGLLAKFVDYYIINADAFNYFKNTEFEKEFALDSDLKPYTLNDKDDKNYFIKGFIDRFDELENHINIVDYKSKKVSRPDKEKQEEVDELKDVQLALYILYAKQQYPNKSFDSHLLSFKGNEKGVKFAQLEDIEDEKLKQLIYDTKNNIEDGKFPFDNSDEKSCGWCDYRFVCHESILSYELRRE